MKKILAVAVAACLLLLGGSFGFPMTETKADDKVDMIKFHIDLNQDFTTKSNKKKLNEVGFEKHLGKKASESLPASFIQVNLDVQDHDSIDHNSVSGEGIVKIGTETFPFTIEQQPFPVYMLADGTTLYSGGLTGKIKTKQGDSIFILGVDHYPANISTFVSTFIGELDETQGLGVLRFGSPILTKEMGAAIEAKKAEESAKSERQGSVNE